MDRISERDLILPSLLCIEKNNRTITTTELIQKLRDLLHPNGEDLSILKDRSDDKFSQKVRNLVSHKTLEKLGFATYEKLSNVGLLTITTEGVDFLREKFYLIEYLLVGEFSYDDTKEVLNKLEIPSKELSKTPRNIMVFDEDIIISEGNRVNKERTTYTRSKKLRDSALQYYAVEGRVVCLACQFDFESMYGELGKGFIEIHHMKPIVAFEDEDLERKIQDALKEVIPLCSNCHRMVHRRKGFVLSLDELSEIIKLQREMNNKH
jgi:5-methylcytosine-specific restriction enzyme A